MDIFCQYWLDLDDNPNINFKNLLKKTMGLLKTKKKLASMVLVEEKSQGGENLVKKYNQRTCISFTLNYLFTPILYEPTSLPIS